jgi:hypothetical protein
VGTFYGDVPGYRGHTGAVLASCVLSRGRCRGQSLARSIA